MFKHIVHFGLCESLGITAPCTASGQPCRAAASLIRTLLHFLPGSGQLSSRFTSCFPAASFFSAPTTINQVKGVTLTRHEFLFLLRFVRPSVSLWITRTRVSTAAAETATNARPFYGCPSVGTGLSRPYTDCRSRGRTARRKKLPPARLWRRPDRLPRRAKCHISPTKSACATYREDAPCDIFTILGRGSAVQINTTIAIESPPLHYCVLLSSLCFICGIII